MEQDSNPSGLCKMGCGFFGNQSFEGMCSKCYRDFVKRQQQSSPTTGRASPASCVSTTAVSSVSALANTLISNAQSQAAATAAQPVADGVQASPQVSAPQSVAEPSTATTSTTTTTADVAAPSPSKPIDIPRTPEKVSPTDSGSASATPSSMGTPTSPGDGEGPSPGKMKKRNRCFQCRKKVGLTGFECRCGGLFCGNCRYSDKHNCTFDYKTDGRQAIAKANPVVVGEKVAKI